MLLMCVSSTNSNRPRSLRKVATMSPFVIPLLRFLKTSDKTHDWQEICALGRPVFGVFCRRFDAQEVSHG